MDEDKESFLDKQPWKSLIGVLLILGLVLLIMAVFLVGKFHGMIDGMASTVHSYNDSICDTFIKYATDYDIYYNETSEECVLSNNATYYQEAVCYGETLVAFGPKRNLTNIEKISRFKDNIQLGLFSDCKILK